MKLTGKVSEIKHYNADYTVTIGEMAPLTVLDCMDEADALNTVMQNYISEDYDYDFIRSYENGGLTVWVFDITTYNDDDVDESE